MIYGVLVWATLLVLLLTTGFGLGVGYFAGVRDFVSQDRVALNVAPTELAAQTLGEERLSRRIKDNSPELAWWTLAGVALALFASVGGALVGAGPEMVLKRVKGRRVVAVPAAQ
jgi:cytochrome bd-type quinol oxidase subunit 2